MKPPAFQFYADDFLSGTSDMSPEEVGIYIRLLCHQWTKGGLPTDEPRLARMAGIDGNAMVLPSLSYVLAKFTASPDGLLRNGRMERVRAEQDANRAKRSSAGAKGAESRWGNGKRNGNAMPEPLAKPSQNDSSPSPTPTPLNTLIPSASAEGERVLSNSPTAEQIYQAYPRKVGKVEALKAITKAGRAIGFDRLLAKVQEYGRASAWQEMQYIPHPATWMNAGRYDDDPETWKDPKNKGGGARVNNLKYV
jgi:uncharacterized protein YdaU (DUF1376 family)